MTKLDYRLKTLDKLTQLSQEVRDSAESSLIIQFKDLINKHGYQKIGLYYGKFPELTTDKIFKVIENIDIYLPRIEAERKLSFHLYRLGDPLEVVWGLKQPTADAPKIEAKDLDLIVVPGVAFNPEGFRVGFGGGYYDRLLAKVFKPTVSLIFQEQLYDNNLWPIEDHDKGVDLLLIDQREEV